MLKSALHWLNQGIAVIPIAYRTKIPDSRLLPIKYDQNGQPVRKRNGRIQHDWETYQKRLPTEQQVIDWFSAGEHNLAVITGWRNLAVVDFDDVKVYTEWQLNSTLPSTYSVLTPRGVHLYFFLEKPTNSFKLNKIDVQSTGKYAITSPSVHPSGVTYTVLDKSTPILSVESITDVLDIPKEIKTIIKPRSNGNGWGNDLVSRVKKNYPILSFFPEAEKSGARWYKTLCPFHADTHESFWIDASRGLCGCFANCTPKPLDAIDLWAVLNNMSIEEAIAEMQERAEL